MRQTNPLHKHSLSLAAFLLCIGMLSPAFAKEERNDMLAAASVKNGHAITSACTICHTFDKGGPDQSGPNLFGIIGAKHAHSPSFEYSDALKRMHDKSWTVDRLDEWLKNPGAYAPGTTMFFGGLLDPQDRADVIAYLRTLK